MTVLGIAACGTSDERSPAPAAPTAATGTGAAPGPEATAPVLQCRHVPRRTVRVIASHANRRTTFNVRSAAAVDAAPGYAVSVMTFAGGTRRVGTWFVDDLRAPQTVTSGNTQALQITNWPLESLAPDSAGQSRICAAKNLRGPGPLS